MRAAKLSAGIERVIKDVIVVVGKEMVGFSVKGVRIENDCKIC
jgi:hypothetical protein